MNLIHLLNSEATPPHPLFLPKPQKKNTFLFDFSTQNPELAHLDFKDIQAFENFVFKKLNDHNAIYGIGGYLENREIYRRSELFNTPGQNPRCIHLGLDVWTQANTPVYAPLDAVVHSFKNNDNYGDYGPTIILKHQIGQISFHTLYGHLSPSSIEKITEGQRFEKGEIICQVGNHPYNGDWPAHLHFQIILNMQHFKGDYPGVCRIDELKFYKENCPDPAIFLPLA